MNIDTLINELGDICHQHYQGSVREDGKDLYQYDTEVIWMLDTPEAKQAIKNYSEKLIEDIGTTQNKSEKRALADRGIDGEKYSDDYYYGNFCGRNQVIRELKQQLRDKWLNN